MKKLRIAQLAPFWYDVPPKNYGGTERIVSYITEELVRRGHDVTLFAAEGSVTAAKLVSPVSSKILSSIKFYCDPTYLMANQLTSSALYKRAGEFDMIHSHASFVPFGYCDLVKTPTVHTLHNFMPRPFEAENVIFAAYKHLNFVSISHDFRRHFDLNYVATVYHGTQLLSEYSKEPGEYLFWIGRVNKNKGELDAMEAATRSGEKLIMALSVRDDTKEYVDSKIKPKVTATISLRENIPFDDVWGLYSGAKALILPISWDEPFGMVMIEAMACGTPVIAYNRGSVAEIVKDGVTGFIVDPKLGVDGLVAAIKRINQIDRAACRKHVEEHFTVEKMVDRYEDVYTSLL